MNAEEKTAFFLSPRYHSPSETQAVFSPFVAASKEAEVVEKETEEAKVEMEKHQLQETMDLVPSPLEKDSWAALMDGLGW